MANTYPTIHRLDGGVTSETSLGRVNSTLMDTVFKGSPLLTADAEEYRNVALSMLLGPDYTANANGGSTTSWDFPTYVRSYSDGESDDKKSPSITATTEPPSDQEIGSHYYPNSAYASDAEADDPRAVGTDGAIAQNGYPFAVGAGGDGATANPSENSSVNDTRNSSQQTIGQYIMGANQ